MNAKINAPLECTARLLSNTKCHVPRAPVNDNIIVPYRGACRWHRITTREPPPRLFRSARKISDATHLSAPSMADLATPRPLASPQAAVRALSRIWRENLVAFKAQFSNGPGCSARARALPPRGTHSLTRTTLGAAHATCRDTTATQTLQRRL